MKSLLTSIAISLVLFCAFASPAMGAGKVKGVVKDNEGTGVANVAVEIYRFGRLAASTTTAEDGTYVLDGVPSGNNLLKIQFSVAGSIAEAQSFSLPCHTVKRINATLPPEHVAMLKKEQTPLSRWEEKFVIHVPLSHLSWNESSIGITLFEGAPVETLNELEQAAKTDCASDKAMTDEAPKNKERNRWDFYGSARVTLSQTNDEIQTGSDAFSGVDQHHTIDSTVRVSSQLGCKKNGWKDDKAVNAFGQTIFEQAYGASQKTSEKTPVSDEAHKRILKLAAKCTQSIDSMLIVQAGQDMGTDLSGTTDNHRTTAEGFEPSEVEYTKASEFNDVWVVGEDGQATKISLITDASDQFKITETRFSFYGGQVEELGQQEDVIEIKEPVIDAFLIKEDMIAFISEGKDKDTATFSAVMKITH